MVRATDLTDLYQQIRNDAAFDHLRTDGIRLVPGIGAERPKVMVVGEAPGATENEQGRPFCGVSGQVLDQLMALAGLYATEWFEGGAIRREPNVWLTNTVKYRPPGNRTPWFTEIAHSVAYLRQEWALIGKPRLIVCVGSVAAQAIGAHTPSQVTRGQFYGLKAGVWVCYQYHPAYGLRGGPDRQRKLEAQWEIMGLNILAREKELGWRTQQ